MQGSPEGNPSPYKDRRYCTTATTAKAVEAVEAVEAARVPTPPVRTQCALAGVSRASVYAHQRPVAADVTDLVLCQLIDGQYTARPFYGTRRMALFLRSHGHSVNRKRVQRLMRGMGLAGMAPGPNTSRVSTHPAHKIYPYLLRGVAITRPNQVWSTDITYIRLAHGFAYLVAVMDGYSRRVLAWRASFSMEASFCVDCLQQALSVHGKPEVFNSDQSLPRRRPGGSQFTSEGFIGVLKANDIKISMDGRGRAFDNIFVERLWRTVKYEDVYLKGYAAMGELLIGLTQYFELYNAERPHQALNDRTPDAVYGSGVGGGAIIVDKYPRAAPVSCGQLRSPQDTGAAATPQHQINNQGSAVQLHVTPDAQLKLNRKLS